MNRFQRWWQRREAPSPPPAPSRPPNWKSELLAELSLNAVDPSLLRASEREAEAPSGLFDELGFVPGALPPTQAAYDALLTAVYGNARERFVALVCENAYFTAAVANWTRLDTLRRQQRTQLIALELSNALGACYDFTPQAIRSASGLQAFFGTRGFHLTPTHANLPLPLLVRAILQAQLEAMQATRGLVTSPQADPARQSLMAAWQAGYGFGAGEATRLTRSLATEFGWPQTVL